MLDDLRQIHEDDRQDVLGLVEKQWQQLEYTFEVQPALKPLDCTNVVFAGMGGSALAAMYAKAWLDIGVPFEIVRSYDIPAYVGPETLFIACSFSGNTEETVEATKQAVTQKAHVAVITGGGELAQIAQTERYPLVVLPEVTQSRFAVLYTLKALATVITSAGVIGASEELASAASWLKTESQAWLPTVTAKHNQAKQSALECMGRSIVMNASTKLFPAAYKWKIGFNENAKQVAWASELPESSHNEFIGWSKQPGHKPYAVIDLRSRLDHPRIQKRFEVTERLLSGLRPSPLVIEIAGDTQLKQLLWAGMLGDFVTVYTALLNGVNPTSHALIEKFKKYMAE